MKITRVIAAGILFLMAGLTAVSPALGQMIQGEVTEVNTGDQSLRIARMDPQSKSAEPESIKVYLSADTKLEGLAGLDELRPGDEVWAEVSRDARESWLALSLRLDKVDIKDPGDAAAAAKASSIR